MSTPHKPGSPVTWRTIEKVAGQAERDRMAELGEKEVDAELRKAGIDPEDAVAAVQQAVDDDRGGRAQATASSRPRVIAGGAAARGASAKASRGWWWSRGGMVAAAALAAAGLLLTLSRQTVTPVAHAPELTPRDRAESFRQKAYVACDRKAWAECGALLDEAKGLDPEGDANPRVKSRRDAIRDAKAP